jgi:ankyrin repeat protein
MTAIEYALIKGAPYIPPQVTGPRPSAETLVSAIRNNGPFEEIFSLVQQGAMPTHQALDLAVSNKQAAVVNLLLSAGGMLWPDTAQAERLIKTSIENNDVATLKILRRFAGDASIIDTLSLVSLETFILQALKHQQSQLLEQLLQIQQSFNQDSIRPILTIKSSDGLTPLMQAIRDNNYEIVCILLKYGADPMQTTSLDKESNITPLMLASSAQVDLQIAHALINAVPESKKIDFIKMPSERGITALDIAQKNDANPDFVRILQSYLNSEHLRQKSNSQHSLTKGAAVQVSKTTYQSLSQKSP